MSKRGPYFTSQMGAFCSALNGLLDMSSCPTDELQRLHSVYANVCRKDLMSIFASRPSIVPILTGNSAAERDPVCFPGNGHCVVLFREAGLAGEGLQRETFRRPLFAPE
jgi:hypothetical protein